MAATAKKSESNSPRRRAVSCYPKLTRKEVADKLRRSKWTGLSLQPDIYRIASGKAQIAFLMSVYYHTEGSPHNVKNKHWKAPEFTPVMVPGDFALESGFSRPSIIEAQEDAVERGLVARMGESGPEFCRFKLLRHDWPAMPNEDVPEFPDKKGPKSEGIEDEEDAPPPEEDARTPARVAAGSTIVWGARGKGGRRVSFPVQNQTRIDVAIASAVVDGVEGMVIAEHQGGDVQVPKGAHPKNGSGSQKNTSAPRSVGMPTLVSPKKNGVAPKNGYGPTLDLADFPHSTKAVTAKYKPTELSWLARTFGEAIDAAVHAGGDREAVTDEVMLGWLRKAEKKDQRGAGWFATSLPPVAEAWGRGEDPGPGGGPGNGAFESDEERAFRERVERKMRFRNNA